MPSRTPANLIASVCGKSRRNVVIAICCVATAFFGSQVFGQQPLAVKFDEARQHFQPVTEQTVAAALVELQQRMQEVEQYVEPSSANGQQWLKYLKWNSLTDRLKGNNPRDVEAFDSTLGRLNRSVNGTERAPFRRLARALKRYRDTLAVSTWEKPADLYNKQLDALQRAIDAYRRQPTPQSTAALSQRIRILDAIGQAPQLVDAVRRDLSRPNAFVSLSAAYIAAGADPIDRSEPVTDCILGTNIHSDTHTTGSVSVVAIPSADRAMLEFISHGHTWARSVGYHSPAVIHSTSDTDFTARKRVELSDEAFSSQPAYADATTDTHLQSVSKQGGGFGSRLVARGGMRRARQSEHQAEAIAADHAESRIERQFNDELDGKLSSARRQYLDDFRGPLDYRGSGPEHIHFSSTNNSVEIQTTQATRVQLAAPTFPPAVPAGHDIAMQLHESAVNNYAAAVLAGASAVQTRPDEDVHFDVDLPSWMKRMWEKRRAQKTKEPAANTEPFKPFLMTLNDTQPISVRFLDGGKVEMTLHIADLYSGDNHFSNWNVTGTYTHELVDGRVRLHRDGKLVLLPADFNGKLDITQTGERRNLEKEFDKRSAEGHGFPMTIDVDPISPSGDLAKAGPLEYREFSTGGGWLTIGVDRQSRSSHVVYSEPVIETSWSQ